MYLLSIIIIFFVYVILRDAIGDFLSTETKEDKIKDTDKDKDKDKDKNKIKILDEKHVNFNVYTTKKDAVINHYPGKIMIKEDHNVVINSDSENILMEKDKIYTLDDDFSVEIINLSGDNIIYYYI